MKTRYFTVSVVLAVMTAGCDIRPAEEFVEDTGAANFVASFEVTAGVSAPWAADDRLVVIDSDNVSHKFGLDAGVLSNIAEIFVEDNKVYEEMSLSSVFSTMGKSCASGQQFDGLKIVFLGHNYVAETIPATCIEYGYDLLTCDRCGYENKRILSNDTAVFRAIIVL